MSEEEDIAKIILKENGTVEIEGEFNTMTLIGLLEHELAYQRAKLKINQEKIIREGIKNGSRNKEESEDL